MMQHISYDNEMLSKSHTHANNEEKLIMISESLF